MGALRHSLRCYFHKAANAFPLGHGGDSAARIDHHDPALGVRCVGFVFKPLERQPDDQAAVLAGAIGAEIGDAGSNCVHTLPGHEPEIAILFGDADFAALAVEAQRRA